MRNWFRQRRQRKRRGMTLVETIIALIIMALGVVVMARITQSSVQQQASIDSQYTLISIDAVMSDIYHDFHAAETIQVTKTGSGVGETISLVFDLGEGVVHLYDWVYEGEDVTVLENGKEIKVDKATFYVNGKKAFDCAGFEVTYLSGELYVAIHVEGDKRLEMTIYR